MKSSSMFVKQEHSAGVLWRQPHIQGVPSENINSYGILSKRLYRYFYAIPALRSSH